MNVDIATGMITDFDMEYHGGYHNGAASFAGDHDFDDFFDFDDDFDDFFDWD